MIVYTHVPHVYDTIVTRRRTIGCEDTSSDEDLISFHAREAPAPPTFMPAQITAEIAADESTFINIVACMFQYILYS